MSDVSYFIHWASSSAKKKKVARDQEKRGEQLENPASTLSMVSEETLEEGEESLASTLTTRRRITAKAERMTKEGKASGKVALDVL